MCGAGLFFFFCLVGGSLEEIKNVYPPQLELNTCSRLSYLDLQLNKFTTAVFDKRDLTSLIWIAIFLVSLPMGFTSPN